MDEDAAKEATGATETDEEPDPDVFPYGDIESALRAATELQTLKRVWAENRAAFDDEKWGSKLMDAYKETGKSISAASAK